MTIRTTLLTAAVALGVVLGGAPAGAAPTERGVLAVPVRIGSFNINASQSDDVWANAIAGFMPMVDVAGLQEVTTKGKTDWLLRADGWGSYRPPELRQNPVIWDDDVFDLISGRGEKVADGRPVEVKKVGGDSVQKDRYATVVRLRHRATGQSVSIVNLHLISGAVNGGKPIAGRPRLYRLYVDEVAGVSAVVAEEKAWSDGRVYVVGDFNDNYLADRRWRRAPLAYARLTGLGLLSAWESRSALIAGQGSGTRGGSYLDGVWSTVPALDVSVKRSFHVSDHYPIVSRYALPPLGPAPSPPTTE